MDPQYYEFKSLCKDNSNKMIVFNKDYLDLKKQFIQAMMNNSNIRIKNNGIKYFYNEKLNETFTYYDIKDTIKSEKRNGNIITIVYDKKYKKMPKPFATYIRYKYENDGVFLRGDEGSGLYFTYEEVFTCSYFDNFK
ncbi:hypothetical protein [Campylobacter jejuni]|uniref:Sugar transferase n=1 Tax=Campylobacter jejuni TaxID=197 RepID=A0AAX0NH86_CAMJU|nr:hypothetical protein [Campylobacter jejuni]OSY73571.1 hypothetical protein B5Y32_09575 [Campylobacter jejuni]